MHDRSTADEFVTGASPLTAAPSTTLVSTAAVVLAAAAAAVVVGSRTTCHPTAAAADVGSCTRLERVRVEKFVMAGRRRHDAGLVVTRRTLRNQILRAARFLRRILGSLRSRRTGLLTTEPEVFFQQFRHQYQPSRRQQ